LADRAWTSRQSLEGDAYYSFRQIVDYAIEHKLPIIAAGDLIDKQRNESRVVAFLSEQMRRLRDADVWFLYIQGQHEYQPIPWLSALSDWPDHLDAQVIDLPAGISVGGYDWSTPDVLEVKLGHGAANADVLVMHQVTQEWMGGIAPGEVAFTQIPDVEALIIGDYHELSGVEHHKGAQGQPLTVLSPGSTCMQSISEPVNKYFYVMYDDLSFEAVPLKTRKVLKPNEIWLPEQLDTFVENVGHQLDGAVQRAIDSEFPGELHKPILYVKYSSQLEDAYRRLERAIGDRAHFFYKELRPEATEEQKKQRQVREQILVSGLVGALPEVAPSKESTRYCIAYELLQSKNPREVLSRLRTERLGLSQ